MKTFFGFFAFLSLFNCVGYNFNLNFSEDRWVEKFRGTYESNYKNTVFEIWIEEANHADLQKFLAPNSLFVFVFEKSRRTEIEVLIRKYHDSQKLEEDVCSYVENLSWGVHGLWNARDIGGLAGMTVPAGATNSPSLHLETLFYMDFPVDDEYGFVSLEINREGDVEKLIFFETGFMKKPWNYFLNSSMKLQKVSRNTPQILSEFYLNAEQVNRKTGEHQGNKDSYCN